MQNHIKNVDCHFKHKTTFNLTFRDALLSPIVTSTEIRNIEFQLQTFWQNPKSKICRLYGSVWMRSINETCFCI
jgi:hypothetical protein